MERTLAQHITGLQGVIEKLTSDLMQTEDPERRNRIEADIRAANLALTHYRAALDLESRLEKVN